MSKLKKQLLTLLIMFVFVLSLIGCSSNNSVQETVEAKETKTQSHPVSNVIKANVKVSGTLKIHYIDVGQADSILIQQDEHNMLIDAGNNGDSDLVVNYLKKNNVKKLDYVVGTHPHEDHIGSLDTVINNFEIGKVLMPKATSTTRTFKDVVTAIKNKNLKITEPIPGTTYNLGEASWTVLAPSKNKDYEDANNYSIVCKLKYGNTSFIFTGDAEDISEKEILARGYDLKSDVLKIGHHGSSSSTTDAFLTAVNPKYAIISCGKGNDYGHPHKPTMDKLKSKKIPVYRTDECGTIVCTSDGTKITFDKKPGDYNYNGTGTSNKSSSSTSTQSNRQNTNTSTNSNKTVYFTPSGKSYHFDKNCSTLKRSKKILQGSLQEAINSGHKDPCNVCAGGN
ncbi:MAG: ComEC/Rec2 family competence protein [Clostridiaceae bacterium]